MTISRSLFFRLHQCRKGQAMAEFCVAVPLLVLLLWSIWYVSDLYIMKHKTLVAARYGAWKLSRYDNLPNHTVTRDQVRDSIAAHFFDNNADGLEVKQFDEGDPTGIMEDGPLLEEWAGDIAEFLNEHLMGADTPPVYALSVTHRFPRVFGAVDLREASDEYFYIRSEHYVLGNSWDGGRTDIHDMIGLIETAVADLIEGIADAL